MNKNNTVIKKPNSKNGFFQNIYFVGFLFLLSFADFVRLAIKYDYKIVNILFMCFSFYLCIKILKKKKKSNHN